jgi:hypothetical protein
MRLLPTALLLVGLLSGPTPARAADPIPASQFDRLHQLIKPAPGEDRWASVPWRTSLWEARQEAARLGKPLVLWEMDGHPLGCT